MNASRKGTHVSRLVSKMNQDNIEEAAEEAFKPPL